MSDSNLVIIVPVAFRLPEEIRVIGARYRGYRVSNDFFPSAAYFAEATGSVTLRQECYASMEINVAPRADGYTKAGHWTLQGAKIEKAFFGELSGMLSITLVAWCAGTQDVWDLQLDISEQAFEGMRLRSQQVTLSTWSGSGPRSLKA